MLRPFAALALLDAPQPLRLAELAEGLRRAHPALASGISVDESPRLSLRIGGGAVAVTPSDRPVEGLALGKGAPQRLIRHKAHVACATVATSGDPRGDALHLGYVVAQLCRQMGARGVYWPTSGAFLPADLFVEKVAASQETWPTDVWLRFSVESRPLAAAPKGVGYRVRTRGLHPFFGYEMELSPAPQTPSIDRMARRAVQVASYLFTSGGVIKDGDTLDFGEAPRLKARLEREPRGEVASLMLSPEPA